MKIALTFDAELPGREHRSPDAPWDILSALAAHSVRATFFIQGRFANAEPALVRRIAQDGHLIGNHSHYHAPMTSFARVAAFAEDVKEAEMAILRTTGVDPRPYFRCPYGRVDVDAASKLGSHGYQHVGWDFDVADWEPETTVDEIASRVIVGIREHGPVVLLHTWPRTTAEALHGILRALVDHEFVGLDDLFVGDEP